MTIGQRIAQKRKELSLSQEQLGEQLGVSRQAIYKWESDSALPEVEKLVALSKLFGVSVGWLLGVEEAAGPEKSAGELTEEQLRMVEEIVDRYLAARPEPEPVKVRRWPRVVGAAAIIAGVIVAVRLSGDFKNMKSQVSGLQNSLSNVSYNVSSEIGSITDRVEEILKSQNQLTAEYEVKPVSSDLTANTVTFAASAVPKTYVAGMRAVFLARSGNKTISVEGVLDEGNRFSATLTCPLTNDISLSVVFSAGGKEETQLLDSYDWLLAATQPDVYVNGTLWAADVRDDGVLPYDTQLVNVQSGGLSSYGDWYQPSEIQTIRMGLFKDRKLLFWYTEEEESQGWISDEDCHLFRRTQEVTLEDGAEYTEAAVITDQYGRTFVAQDTPVVYSAGDHSLSHSVSSYDAITDPSEWEY